MGGGGYHPGENIILSRGITRDPGSKLRGVLDLIYTIILSYIFLKFSSN